MVSVVGRLISCGTALESLAVSPIVESNVAFCKEFLAALVDDVIHVRSGGRSVSGDSV